MLERAVQFSVYLGNKPAMLAKICRELAKAKINILAMTMMDAAEHGVLRVISEDVERTRQALKDTDAPTTETQVVTIAMPNKPGAVAEICERLSDAKISISYMYCTTGGPGGKAIGVFKLNNVAKAEKILEDKKSAHRDMRVKLRNRQNTKAVGRR